MHSFYILIVSFCSLFLCIYSAATKGFVYSSFLKLYNPRQSHSDVSIESQSSSNESGYGGSSPVFSRQNSNSTLTFNPETSTVSFMTGPPSNHASLRPVQDSTPGCRTPYRDTSSPNYPASNERDSLESMSGNSTDQKDLSETSNRHSVNHRDVNLTMEASFFTPVHHRDVSDSSETDSLSSNRNSGHDGSQRHTGTRQRCNGETSDQQIQSHHAAEEPSDPDQEMDGHQVCRVMSFHSALK